MFRDEDRGNISSLSYMVATKANVDRVINGSEDCLEFSKGIFSARYSVGPRRC